MTTIPVPITLSAGSSRTGNAANVVAACTDAGGTTRSLGALTWAEEADAAASATTGVYWALAQFDPTWTYPVKVKLTITGQSGFAADVTVRAADLTPTDASGYVKAATQTNADKTGYTASTVSDKTGYSLAASQTFNLTGNVTGNLSGSVGSVTGAVGSVTGAVGSVTGAVGSVAAAVTAGTVTDKTGYALTTAEHTAISGTDVPAALTAQGYTAARAPKLDNLDTNVNSRMATFAYTAPANPTDYARNNVAPSWWVSPDNADVATALSDLVTLVGRADPATALTTLQTAASAIKAKTDLLTFTGPNVNAAISGDATTTLYGDAGAIDWTYTVFDVDGTTPLPGVSVQVAADSAGTHRSQAKLTDSLGRVHFSLDAGTVYVFRSRVDREFSNPDTETVGL